MKETLSDLGIILIKIGIMEKGKTNLWNANIDEIKNLSIVINHSVTEIEAANHNHKAEVCVALQFLKDTVMEILTININWIARK